MEDDLTRLKEELAQYWLDGMDLKCLMAYYYDMQMEFLDELSEDEVLEIYSSNGLADED